MASRPETSRTRGGAPVPPRSGGRLARRSGSPLNGLDLTTLRLLLAASEEGNLGRAAERENIALSALSRRISDFELRYGVTMLDRHDRGVTPTPDGRILIDRIAEAIEQLERIACDILDLRDGTSGHIRIRAHMSASISGALPERLAEFLDTHPSIDIELDEGTSLDVVHAVRVGACDLGLISGTVDGGGLRLIPWTEDELVAVLPAGSPLGQCEVLALADLLDEPFIGMQRDSALLTLYRTRAAAANRVLRERAHAMSFEAVRAMVGAGLGVAILPAVAAEPFAGEGGILVRRLTDSWAHRPLMLCVRGAAVTAATRLLIRHLVGEERAREALRSRE